MDSYKDHYPKWVYHKSGASKVLHSRAEHEEHGLDEWRLSPVDHVKCENKPPDGGVMPEPLKKKGKK